MSDSADILVQSINDDLMNFDDNTASDFGFSNLEPKLQGMLFGVYHIMVKRKNVDAELLRKCFISGRLDELIDKKNTHYKSMYYNELRKSVPILQTSNSDVSRERDEEIDLFVITDDDTCDVCHQKGLVSKSHGNIIDCNVCYRIICHRCIVGDPMDGYTCKDCLR
jgi:hypothetical protein